MGRAKRNPSPLACRTMMGFRFALPLLRSLPAWPAPPRLRSTKPGSGGFQAAGGRLECAGQSKAIRGHVVVDGLEGASLDEIGLMPNPDVAIASDCAVEGVPGRKMRSVPVGRILLEVLEASPI